jgi:hypothetical protein
MGDAPKGQPDLKDAPEIGRVARVETPCAFDDGRNNWQDGLINFGDKLLSDFPTSRWAPYVHLTLARTYASKLLLTYPGVELDGANKPDNPDTLRREAIAHFRAFLAGNRESPEASSAWREIMEAARRTTPVAKPFRLHRLICPRQLRISSFFVHRNL